MKYPVIPKPATCIMQKKYIVGWMALICAILLNASPVLADTSTDNNFILDVGNIDSSVEIPTATPVPPTSPAAQTDNEVNEPSPPGIVTGDNYWMQIGLDPRNPLVSLGFTLSNNIIDFGPLSATNPVARTNRIVASNPSGPYQIFAFEDHPLQSPTKIQIPDTSCDNGACTDITQAGWQSNLAYGFGYRCDNAAGVACMPEFADTTVYKQFPAVTDSEIPQPVIKSFKSGTSESDITYKVNVSGTQPSGSYANIIMYIAAPGY